MNMSLTKAIQDYIDKSPYLTNDEVEEATMYNDAGEWAVSLEYVCARLTAYMIVNKYALSPQEMEELEALIDDTRITGDEYFNESFLCNVKKASNFYSSKNIK